MKTGVAHGVCGGGVITAGKLRAAAKTRGGKTQAEVIITSKRAGSHFV
jgi:hypothetical protein